QLPRSLLIGQASESFVSVLDSSTLDEATNNFSFEESTAPALPSRLPKLVTRPWFLPP
ncbi:hypothetical protein Cadr_000003145, partial [Camelus dromedarius]